MNNDMFGKCGMTQFVGVGVCDTIGLYIANIDDDLRKQMNIPEKFHAVGLSVPVQVREHKFKPLMMRLKLLRQRLSLSKFRVIQKAGAATETLS